MGTASRYAGTAEEDALLEQLAKNRKIHPTLPFELLHLVRDKYPMLDLHGAKTSLERDVISLIEKAVAQADAADPAQHDF